MYHIIIEWHDNFCLLNEESDFFKDLRNLFPISNKSKDRVEEMVYEVLNNLPNNHYGTFAERTYIKHKIIF